MLEPVGLTRAEIAVVMKRGGPEAALRAALKDPDYGEQLRDVRIVIHNRTGRPFLWIEQGGPSEETVWRFVAAWAGDDEQVAGAVVPDGLVAGKPYSRNEYVKAGELHAKKKMTVAAIELYNEMSRKRAHRIHQQFTAGAVIYDENRKQLLTGPGYRWDPVELANDPPRFRLIRV